MATVLTQAEGSVVSAQSLLAKVASLATGDSNFAAASTEASLWPVRSFGKPNRISLAGIPEIEPTFHTIMASGQWLESSLGEAMGVLLRAKKTTERQITQYFDITRVSTTSKLPHLPRVIKSVADCIHFMKQIQVYLADIQAYLMVMQTNLALLLEMEKRMLAMLQQNESLLTALLNDICNWKLPNLPSMPTLISSLLQWPGFNFNTLSGFKLPSIQNLISGINFNTNFTFSSCTIRSPDLSSLFSSPTNTVTSQGLTVTTAGGYSLPLNGLTGDPTQYTNPDYIATMQSTGTIVIDPATFDPNAVGSLPNPTSIISNYQLTPAQYQSNIVDIVPDLSPVVGTQSPTDLQQRLTLYVTLNQVVASDYDPNLTAAWILYLNLNRLGRAGTWVSPFVDEYNSSIVPSVAYIMANNVPYNNVLGGTGVQDAPTAIPLIELIGGLTGTAKDNLLWRLSFIEAALLGYQRSTTWDNAGDSTYLTGITGSQPDYKADTGSLTAQSTQILGAGTAEYPVSCTFPTEITSILNQVIEIATLAIAGDTLYQSVQPKNRYTYDIFANAILVDRYSQFWRDFNQNLQTLLGIDPYELGFVIQNSEILNSAINPLSLSNAYASLALDTSSRNRNWTPGSVLLTIPSPLTVEPINTVPTNTTSGWSEGTFDPATFLARPDVQAQPIPTQIAMLRLNQSYANLETLKANIVQAVSNMQTNIQTSISTVSSSGWEVDTDIVQVIPPGQSSTVISFETVAFDQGNYVEDPTTILMQSAGFFALTGQVNWDPAGVPGNRSVYLLQNGVVVESTQNDPDSTSGFSLGFSTLVSLEVGDVIQVAVSHGLDTSQNIVNGSFLGLNDPTASPADTVTPPNPSITLGQTSSTNATPSMDMPAATAVSIQPDGTVMPVPVTQASATPVITHDGVLLAASSSGTPAPIGQSYGNTYSVPSASFSPGSLLYVKADGTLGAESELDSSVKWLVVVGKAVTSTSYIHQPQVPFFRG